MKLKKSKKGFTLVEGIISIAILTIVVSSVVSNYSLIFKHNKINKVTYDANANIRAFCESLRTYKPRPGNLDGISFPSSVNNVYVFYFDDHDELATLVKDDFTVRKENGIVISGGMLGYGSERSYNEIKAASGGKKYAIQAKVVKNESQCVYEITTKSYELEIGEGSKVSRKYLLAFEEVI